MIENPMHLAEPPGGEDHSKGIFEILEEEQTLLEFYRGIYKASIGHTIGFRINGEWKYNSELPESNLEQLYDRGDIVDQVSVSSIVEGSGVEIEPKVFADNFTRDDFWQAVEAVAEEVSFYWKIDNTSNYKLTLGESYYVSWTAFCNEPEWVGEETVPKDLKEAFVNWSDDGEKSYYVMVGDDRWVIEILDDDSIF